MGSLRHLSFRTDLASRSRRVRTACSRGHCSAGPHRNLPGYAITGLFEMDEAGVGRMRSDVVSGAEGAADVQRPHRRAAHDPKAALRDDRSERPKWWISDFRRNARGRRGCAVSGRSLYRGRARRLDRSRLLRGVRLLIGHLPHAAIRSYRVSKTNSLFETPACGTRTA